MTNIFKLDIPPYPYLSQVLKHCPLAASTYVELWRHKNNKHQVVIDKDNIRNTFLVAPTKFRNDCFSLVNEGLINVDETKTKEGSWYKMLIELVNFEDE
jgi:hypothetical protein